jgi:DNA repair exonuclease SbcCD nuclease subunit
MKLLVTSDWHVDAVTMGHARFADVDRACRETVEAAIREHVDAYCFLGDLCDPDSGSSVFRSVELAISAALELERNGIRSFWMAGNHDVIEDGSGDTTLSPMRPLGRSYPSRIHVIERFATTKGTYTDGVQMTFLPFTATSHPYRPQEFLQGIDFTMGRHLVLGHLVVEGVQPGEETTDMPRGREVMFPRRMFAEQMENVHLLNGHYHRQQSNHLPGFRPVHIPGAPARFTFGEGGHSPSYLLVEV